MTALIGLLASSIGRYLAVALVCTTVSFAAGWSMKASLDRSATYRAMIQKQAVDLKAAREQAESALAHAKTIEQQNTANEEKLRDLTLKFKDGCPLPPDVADRLRRLGR
jgi:hypothetical protein